MRRQKCNELFVRKRNAFEALHRDCCFFFAIANDHAHILSSALLSSWQRYIAHSSTAVADDPPFTAALATGLSPLAAA